MPDPRQRARWLHLCSRHRWRRRLLYLGHVFVAEAMFGSFVLGASLGAGPLRALEVVVGSAMASIGAILLAALGARAARERGARLVVRVREGRRAYRIAVFSDHFTVADEVVLLSTVDRLEIEDGRLLVRYMDMRLEAPVLREFEGAIDDVEGLRRDLGRSRSTRLGARVE